MFVSPCFCYAFFLLLACESVCGCCVTACLLLCVQKFACMYRNVATGQRICKHKRYHAQISANMAHQCICTCVQVCPSVWMHIIASIDMHICAIMSTCECPCVHTYKNYGPTRVHISAITLTTLVHTQKHYQGLTFICTKAQTCFVYVHKSMIMLTYTKMHNDYIRLYIMCEVMSALLCTRRPIIPASAYEQTRHYSHTCMYT